MALNFRFPSIATILVNSKHRIIATRARSVVAACKDLVSEILRRATVLVLNRNWQSINVCAPQDAFCLMAAGVANGLEIAGEELIRPVAWKEWLTLPVREQDEAVRAIRGAVRVPTVIVPASFAKVPRKRPKLCVSGRSN